MKNFLITKLLGFVSRKLDGHKTRIGGIGAILYGLVGLISLIFPDQGMPQVDLDTSIGSITGGFVALGLGGKIEKQTAVLAQTPAAPVRPPIPAAEGEDGPDH